MTFTADDGSRLGMIHRDISPSNVMLSTDGAVKILDFGIAKALGGDKDESTKTGTLKGKFAYMAPEQTTSNDVDRRIDIFATGIVLHEILTGRRLFKARTIFRRLKEFVSAMCRRPRCTTRCVRRRWTILFSRRCPRIRSIAISPPLRWPMPLTTSSTPRVFSQPSWPSSWAACFPPTLAAMLA